MSLESAIDLIFNERIIIEECAYFIRPVNDDIAASQAYDLSAIWVENNTLVYRSKSEFAPNANRQFFILEEYENREAVGCFGVHKFDQFVEIINFCLHTSVTKKGMGKYIVSLLGVHLKEGYSLAAFTTTGVDWFRKNGFEPEPINVVNACRRSKIPLGRNSVFVVRKGEPIESTYSIMFSSQDTKINFDRHRDSTILDSAVYGNVNVDYICHAGICGSCEHSIYEGVVEDVNLGLKEVEKNKILLCSVAPVSDLVLG